MYNLCNESSRGLERIRRSLCITMCGARTIQRVGDGDFSQPGDSSDLAVYNDIDGQKHTK